MRNKIIENIREIDWSKIKTQTSFCTDIPEALLGLMSDDIHTIKNSEDKIDNHVVVQGGLYEGAFYVVPFLQAMLKCQLSSDAKLAIYALLFEIGNGVADLPSNITFSEQYNGFRFFLPNNESSSISLQIACRYAVSLELAQYLADVSSIELIETEINEDDYNLIEEIGNVLMMFTEYRSIIRHYINLKLSQNINPLNARVMNSVLKELKRY